MNILDILNFAGVMLLRALPIALVIFFFYIKSRKEKREKGKRARIRTEESIAQKARRKEEQQKWSSRHTDYTNLGDMLCVKSHLYSALKIDYSQLRDYLAAKQFEEANNLTILHIRSAMEGSGFLHSNLYLLQHYDLQAYERIPCLDLVTIDRLWSQFSEGRFGFGVQVQLWQQGDKSLTHLKYELGWDESVSIKTHVDDMRCVYHEFRCDYGALGRWLQSEAPQGHLPNLFFCKWYPKEKGRGYRWDGGALSSSVVTGTTKVTRTLDDWGSGGNTPIEVEVKEAIYDTSGGFCAFMNRVEKSLDQAV